MGSASGLPSGRTCTRKRRFRETAALWLQHHSTTAPSKRTEYGDKVGGEDAHPAVGPLAPPPALVLHSEDHIFFKMGVPMIA
jgi:hypothetical protein